VILAGGQGTRLRPLTVARAKPVVPLLNRPFLAYQLALLQTHGIVDAILACSYRVDDVKRALSAQTGGVTLRYVIETEPLGTGGGVRNAADLARGTVYVLNGDVLSDADFTAMRQFHVARGSRLTIMLTRVADPRQYGLVETNAEGRIQCFREKPTSDEEITTDTINAGVYLMDAALLRRIPAGRAVSIEREFFPALIADDVPCYGFIATGYWRDIGNPTAYREAQMDLLDGRVRTALAPPGQRHGGVWLAADAVKIKDRVAPPSVVGEDVEISEGARVGPRAVIGAGCRIGAGASVDHAVLWEGVHVGAGARLTGCVVGDRARIGARAQIGANVALEPGAVVADGARIEA